MGTSKDKINWYFIIVGFLFFILNFYFKKPQIEDADLTTKTITLSHNIERHGLSNTSSPYYRLWANETKAAFKINEPASIAAKWPPLDSLKQGDTLTIKYLNNDQANLENNSKEILIYSLQKNDIVYFDTSSYNQSKKAYQNRLNWIIIIFGGLLILRGVTVINSKTTSILVALSLVTLILLSLLHKF